MGLAARAFEPDAPGRFRHMIHDEVEKWVDKIIAEVFVDGKEPTLEELSQLFTETKREFFGVCLQALIEQKYAGLFDQQYAACPQCGKMRKKRRNTSKKLETMQGPGELKERPWYYCVDCSYVFSPLDKVLEISRKMKNNLVMICHWLHLAPPRMIFASAYWEMALIGCGNI